MSSAAPLQLDPRNIVNQSPVHQNAQLQQQIQEFERKLKEEENEVKEVIKENYEVITRQVQQKQDEFKKQAEKIGKQIDGISKSIQLCNQHLPSTEKPKNRLVETLEKRNLELLCDFIKINDPNAYFPSEPIQNPATTMSFLQQSNFLVEKEPKTLTWIASALMSIDLSDPLYRRFCPVVFSLIDESIKNLTSKDARAVKHILRSLRTEFR